MTGSPASSIAAADIEAVRQGELRLLEADVRASPNEIDALLADEFVEYGSSGRILDKAETMAALRAEAGESTEDQAGRLGPRRTATRSGCDAGHL